jgi:hypothetical protein
MFSKILLKLKYPSLKFLKSKKLGGIYTKNGLDLILLKFAYNFLSNNKSTSIIELDKRGNENFLLSNIFIELFSANLFLIDPKAKSIFFFGNDNLVNENKFFPHNLEFESCGITNKFKGISKKSTYKNFDDLKKNIFKNIKNCSILSINYNDESIDLFKNLLEFLDLYFIIIKNNNGGVFSTGNNNLRKIIKQNGYVFFARINNSDDLFISLELINGFPREILKSLKPQSLLKWVSVPKNNDYNKPR